MFCSRSHRDRSSGFSTLSFKQSKDFRSLQNTLSIQSLQTFQATFKKATKGNSYLQCQRDSDKVTRLQKYEAVLLEESSITDFTETAPPETIQRMEEILQEQNESKRTEGDGKQIQRVLAKVHCNQSNVVVSVVKSVKGYVEY